MKLLKSAERDNTRNSERILPKSTRKYHYLYMYAIMIGLESFRIR